MYDASFCKGFTSGACFFKEKLKLSCLHSGMWGSPILCSFLSTANLNLFCTNITRLVQGWHAALKSHFRQLNVSMQWNAHHGKSVSVYVRTELMLGGSIIKSRGVRILVKFQQLELISNWIVTNHAQKVECRIECQIPKLLLKMHMKKEKRRQLAEKKRKQHNEFEAAMLETSCFARTKKSRKSYL